MVLQAIGNVLPAAVAVALSPIPIVAIVVVLGTPRARANGPAFALGWVVGLAAVGTVVVLLTGGADDPDSGTATGVAVVKVALGLAFLGMAVQQWRKRPRRGEEPKTPAWMATVGSITAARAVGLGLLLSAANPKNLALTFAAATSISAAGLGPLDAAIAIAAFVVIGSVTVAGAVVAHQVDAERAARPLAAARQLMADHSTVIMMVILLVLGAKLLGDGLSGLEA
jgi:threonine/homoserine/homoserine lactone efflux protein